MGTARYSNDYASHYNHDKTIATGLSTTWFNPTGDPVGAEVTNVRFAFNLDHNGGKSVDLDKIEIWIQSPDGERNRIYYNSPNVFGDDNDDGNDSDSENDHDIEFHGDDLISSIAFGLDGNPVNGDWGLVIDNRTGITLDLNYLDVWVDYDAPANLKVKDIDISRTAKTGSPVLIETWIENTGDKWYAQPIKVEYLVNGEVIGTSALPGGLLGNKVNYETDLHVFDKVGSNTVEVRIAGGEDLDKTDNSRTETFDFAMDQRPDLIVQDVRVLGGWNKGDTIEIRPFIENIGSASWNLTKGAIHVEYVVDGEPVGSDKLSLGLTPLFGDWESFDYKLTRDGPHKVEVRLSGDDPEVTTANNTWTEVFGADHDTGPRKTLANSGFEVKLGAFMARTVYGQDQLPSDERVGVVKNGLGDDYAGYLEGAGWRVLHPGNGLTEHFRAESGEARFEQGGLFNGDSEDINVFTSFAAQGLLAVGEDPDGARTLALTFRGTDDADFIDAAVGQAWTGNGIYNYYEAMRPLIAAALSYANNDANGVEKLVVSGHSLGGATADLFTLVDAHRLDEEVDLTVVSLASAGLHPKALVDSFGKKGMKGQFDPSLVRTIRDGDDVEVKLIAPRYYVGLSFTNDPVTFEGRNPTPLPMAPNFTLKNNKHPLNGLTTIDLPNIDLTDPARGGEPEGFGAEHDKGLYWAILSQIADDPLRKFAAKHRVTAGETDYGAAPDFDDEDFGVFGTYADVKGEGYAHDVGARRLIGDGGRDYILGLDGDDEIEGLAGKDLLSGGDGRDRIRGGGDDDRISGGGGRDKLMGDAGRDRLSGDGDDDRLNGGGGADLVRGGAGNDAAMGGAGRDKLFGQGGDDRLKGDGGGDRLTGGFGDDALFGAKGRDKLAGGAGDDALFGGEGRDKLKGGGGEDDFHFRRGDGKDVILDWTDGFDAIVIAKGASSFEDLDILQKGAHAVIDYGRRGDVVTLKNADADQLGADDFMFG